MVKFNRLLALALVLWLTACTIILPSPIVIIRNQVVTGVPTATVTASPTNTSTPSPTNSPTATSTQSAPNAVTLVNLRLRSGASINTPILTVIPANTALTLFGRSADSAWLKVQYGAQVGWVSSADNLIQINGAILPSLPIVTANPTPEPSPTRETGYSRISYNINGEGVVDTPYLLQEMTSPCKTMALVMNNLALAVRIKELCPNTLVVSRNYSALEGSEWFYRSPQNFVDQWKREGHPEIIRHSTNEPSYGGSQSLSSFIAAEIELMRLARQNGFTVAMGNFSVGNYQLSDIQNGLYDGYLRAINQYGHYLGLHEYSVALLPFGVGQWPTSVLLDRNLVQPDRWPTASQLPTAFISGTCANQPVYPSYWFLRRGDWWLLRADCLGIARPKILLTEFSWDNLSNIKPQIEPLRSRYGLPQYMNDLRGINTYVNLWAWYFPNWSFARAACEQLKWADSIYPSDYLGMAMFTWSSSKDWAQTNFDGRTNPQLLELHRCLE